MELMSELVILRLLHSMKSTLQLIYYHFLLGLDFGTLKSKLCQQASDGIVRTKLEHLAEVLVPALLTFGLIIICINIW